MNVVSSQSSPRVTDAVSSARMGWSRLRSEAEGGPLPHRFPTSRPTRHARHGKVTAVMYGSGIEIHHHWGSQHQGAMRRFTGDVRCFWAL